jgi:hypothetical protein
MMKRAVASLLFAIASLPLAVACSGGGSPSGADAGADSGTTNGSDAGAASDGAVPDSGDSPEEAAAFDRSGRHTSTAQAIGELADGLFSFDPTIDVHADSRTNAMNIKSNLLTELAGCGTVTLNGSALSVDFGQGCRLKHITVSGALTASVSAPAMGTVQVLLGFAQFTVDGRSLNGMASFSTTTGTGFAVTMSLMINNDDVNTTSSFTINGANGSFTMNGPMTVSAGGSTTLLQLNNVAYQAGDCYPSGGSLTVTSGLITETITFTSASASSGVVTVMYARRSGTKTLPAYGSCPRA